ncbi:MAG: XRE family transcriptional regulator [Planctomycetota bacterium]|nr:MAG: XRE family transcriptional regulator [Planctomycetota bacterium]
MGQMDPFSLFLRNALRARGLTQKMFAQRVKCSYPFLNNVVRGLRGAPDNVETWADELQLEGSQREDFLNLAALSRAEPRIRELIIAHERQSQGDQEIKVPRYLLRQVDERNDDT